VIVWVDEPVNFMSMEFGSSNLGAWWPHCRRQHSLLVSRKPLSFLDKVRVLIAIPVFPPEYVWLCTE
jgi:hypothetical protein